MDRRPARRRPALQTQLHVRRCGALRGRADGALRPRAHERQPSRRPVLARGPRPAPSVHRPHAAVSSSRQVRRQPQADDGVLLREERQGDVRQPLAGHEERARLPLRDAGRELRLQEPAQSRGQRDQDRAGSEVLYARGAHPVARARLHGRQEPVQARRHDAGGRRRQVGAGDGRALRLRHLQQGSGRLRVPESGDVGADPLCREGQPQAARQDDGRRRTGRRARPRRRPRRPVRRRSASRFRKGRLSRSTSSTGRARSSRN